MHAILPLIENGQPLGFEVHSGALFEIVLHDPNEAWRDTERRANEVRRRLFAQELDAFAADMKRKAGFRPRLVPGTGTSYSPRRGTRSELRLVTLS